LFPLSLGFREYPGVFVFAPTWFLCCMLLGYSVFVQIREACAMKLSGVRILVMKLTGLLMVSSALMCEFATIPLWENSESVSLSLLYVFPLWFLVAQGWNFRSITYVACYIILACLAVSSASRNLNLPVESSVISTCLLCVLMQSYPCWFRNNRPRLYCHFEVANTKVVDCTYAPKQIRYLAVEMEEVGNKDLSGPPTFVPPQSESGTLE